MNKTLKLGNKMRVIPLKEEDRNELPSFILDDLKEWYRDNSGQSVPFQRWLDMQSADDVIHYWLEWNGIIGYTSSIKELVLAAMVWEQKKP